MVATWFFATLFPGSENFPPFSTLFLAVVPIGAMSDSAIFASTEEAVLLLQISIHDLGTSIRRLPN
jgi:hypothetical protein